MDFNPRQGDPENDMRDTPASRPEPDSEAIRARIHKTRAALTRKLDLLKSRVFGTPSPARDTTMARRSKSKTRKPAQSAAKKAAAKKTTAKKMTAKKTTAKRTTSKRSVAKKPTRKPTRKRAARPRKAAQVIGDVLTGAALGAVKGAAEVIVPPAERPQEQPPPPSSSPSWPSNPPSWPSNPPSS
jgi:hypothetical protein